MKTGKMDYIGTSAVIDIVLGLGILFGSSGAVKWTKIRTGLGLLLFSIIFLVSKDYFSMTIQILYCLSLLGLIVGTPKKASVISCISFFVLYFGLIFFGFIRLFLMVNK